jgi:hypothetical protein
MVEDKENQAKRLEELRRKREEEEKKRLAEIERLKNEQLMEDISKYQKIVFSEYGKDMKEAAWDNLVSRYPEMSGLAVGDIKGIRKLYPTVLRSLISSYKKLSVSQVQSMSNISIREKKKWGFFGHSTIKHDYNLKTIRGEKVVVDDATGLMWHQPGSRKYMRYRKAKKWVVKLNRKGYAGYSDWRLPTVEEAASLLEPSKRNYIDPVFSNKQEWIWTGDRYGSLGAWVVSLCNGSVYWNRFSKNYVRPVRSME